MRDLPYLHELVLRQEPGHSDNADLLAWCDAADEVTAAYQAWRHAVVGERALAHAAYVAALDREQAASTVLASAA